MKTLLATALAVVSLGITSSALAVEGDPQQAPQGSGGAAAPETPGTGGQTPGNGGQTQGNGGQTLDNGQAEEQAPGEPTQAQQDLDRFNRFCNMKDAEPSHSDKAFCEQFRQANPDEASAAATQAKEDLERFKRFCNMKDAEPSHSDKAFCEKFRKEHPEVAKAASNAAQTQPAVDTTDEDTKDEPDSGPLAFTGLDLWQLGLLGAVLVGGGLGARRLLAN